MGCDFCLCGDRKPLSGVISMLPVVYARMWLIAGDDGPALNERLSMDFRDGAEYCPAVHSQFIDIKFDQIRAFWRQVSYFASFLRCDGTPQKLIMLY